LSPIWDPFLRSSVCTELVPDERALHTRSQKPFALVGHPQQRFRVDAVDDGYERLRATARSS